MSWTQAFTVLSDEHVSAYHDYATPAEKEELQAFFSGRRLDSLDSRKSLICITLSPMVQEAAPFSGQELPLGDSGEQAAAIPEVEAVNPQDLVVSIREAVLSLVESHPDTILRIYLDPAWLAIAAGLVEAGCEVFLMDQASDGPNPAKLWRYLALEEEGRAVTFMSFEELSLIDNYMERTKALEESGLKVWRAPLDRRRNYRPINPDCFACLQSYPALELLCAYAWYIRHPSAIVSLPDREESIGLAPSAACERQASWERAELDEFFLLSAFYPRVAFDGMLTLVEPDDQHSRWLILDTEYVTWANPANETLFVGPQNPPAQQGASSHNFRANAMLEKLFHMNRYPEHYVAWIKQEEESEAAHSCGCSGSDHEHDHHAR